MSFIVTSVKTKYSRSGLRRTSIDSTQQLLKISKRGQEASLALRESLARQYNEKR